MIASLSPLAVLVTLLTRVTLGGAPLTGATTAASRSSGPLMRRERCAGQQRKPYSTWRWRSGHGGQCRFLAPLATTRDANAMAEPAYPSRCTLHVASCTWFREARRWRTGCSAVRRRRHLVGRRGAATCAPWRGRARTSRWLRSRRWPASRRLPRRLPARRRQAPPQRSRREQRIYPAGWRPVFPQSCPFEWIVGGRFLERLRDEPRAPCGQEPCP